MNTDLVPMPAPIDVHSAEFEKTCTEMAQVFMDTTARIKLSMEAIREQTSLLRRAFPDDVRDSYSSRFDIDFAYHGDRWGSDFSDILKKMKREAWQTLVDKLGIKNVMSMATRSKLEAELEHGELPEITPLTIMQTIIGMMGMAKDYATEAAKEVYEMLRPQHSSYVTNQKNTFLLGRRVILSWWAQRAYGGGYRINYSRDKECRALDGVFHILDGKGVIRDYKTPLMAAVETASGGKGETDYFRFKCFNNGNLHLEFKRLDLVQRLNLLAAGEDRLGVDDA